MLAFASKSLVFSAIQLAGALLFLLPGPSAWGETYSATVPIIQDDHWQARQQALRQILQEAGLHGDVAVRSASALINERASQATLITSAYHLQRLAVAHEDITKEQLRLTVTIEKNSLDASNCQPAFPLKQIAIDFQGLVDAFPKLADKENAQRFLEALHRALAQQLATIIGPDEVVDYPPYRLIARQGKEPGIYFDLLGADGQLVMRQAHAIDWSSISQRSRENLGYANLLKTTLSPVGRSASQAIAAALAKPLRCLPTLTRIPIAIHDDIVHIDGIAGIPLQRPTIGLFARDFPVGPGGSVDLLRLEGELEMLIIEGDRIYFRLPKKTAGRPYPAPGSFLLLQ